VFWENGLSDSMGDILDGVPKDSLITQTGKNERRARENQIAHSCKTQN
jgi:hypothetical protein